MAKLVLVRPRINIPDAMPNPPLGLGYLASILRNNGHKVEIIDIAILKHPYSKIISQIARLNPDAIGITALSPYYPEMRNLACMLQKLEIPIILGGLHISFLPKTSLRECKADFAVIGEGELTILELMNNWGDMRSIRDIKGIVYRENERFFINPKREPIKNLDELPFPAWDLMNPLNYKSMPFGRLMKRYPAAPILTSRGCPYRCSFCASTNFWGNKFRRRSPKNVVDEIEYLRDRFGIREIHIWDDNFVFSKKHVVGICYEIRKRKIDMTFTCSNGVHINHLSKELLSLMRKVGFYMLGFTIESGSKAVLKKSNKNLDLKKVSEMAKTAKSLGYYIPGYFIFGLPGENYQNARRTIQFAKKLPLDGMVCFTAKPIPGSKLFVDWSKERSNQNIDYNWFHFLVSKNVLTYTDGKRRINLPRDAMREYHFRPSAILNILKMIFSVSKKFQIKQSREIIRRFFQTYL